MIPEIDIWRAAQLMADRYGDGAVKEAEQRANELGETGDNEGREVWLRIGAAIQELRRGPAEDETVN